MCNLFEESTELQLNQFVKVYKNIRKNLFSVIDKKTRRLITHTDILVLSDVEFKVGQAGQARVRREKQKNVHAYVIGKYVGKEVNYCIKNYELVSYNPYKTDTFITLNNNTPIFKATKCYFIFGKCYVEKSTII